MEAHDVNLMDIFIQIDKKKTKHIKLADFSKMFEKAGYPLTERESKALFVFLDKDASKTVDLQ